MNHEATRGEQAPFSDLAPALQKQLAKLGLHKPFDLVLHLPLRYEDETALTRIADARAGVAVAIQAEVVSTEVMYRPRRQLVCKLADDSGLLYIRFLNFYPSQLKALAAGRLVRLFGEVRPGFFGGEMVHPRYRIVTEGEPLPESLTPVYPTTAGLSQTALRKLILRALSECDLSDNLPQTMRDELQLMAFKEAVEYLHSPPADADGVALEQRTHPAWRRMKFDELLAQQLSMRMHYRARRAQAAPPLKAPDTRSAQLLERLPFRLTGAQQRVWREIEQDLSQPHPMNRLLQGDVGSGKTIVAALAALRALEAGYQAAIMAPTEILAAQHFRKFEEWLAPLGVRVEWLSGSKKNAERKQIAAAIRSGEMQIAVGTHALFQEKVEFAKLALVIVDEQHRFGVKQRLALQQKGEQPHQLMMSATPIPRTLSMSYYADLDVSVIDELPPGRTPVLTKLLADTRRAEVIAGVREACRDGAQVYWVCPLIEESEALDLQTAIDTHAALSAELSDLKVALVHGRLPVAEKAATMAAFKAGDVQVLVATTVIEVGVDVPNASLMVIEHAERFGLAQLHQLRGRVGRGAAQSACILLYQSPLSESARARLKIIYEHTDGFRIAQEDLLLRGPGEYLGARQSGVPLLRFADLLQDGELLDCAQMAAESLLASNQQVAEFHVSRWLAGGALWLRA
ncbi:MAG TPA: ATP-dependent DNA helicase RecG [Burkholderiales bacterium]|nr:ATP-dependent DNA helicase RecG [Burkholderiales bacterium]